MHWIVDRMKGIMLVSGVLTCTMVHAAIAPHAALQSTFGDTLDGPLAEIIVRSWGVLIGLVGAMLIYGAFKPSSRSLILTVAALSKMSFIGLMLVQGRQYLGHQAGLAVVIDSLMVLLFIGYLLGERRGRARG